MKKFLFVALVLAVATPAYALLEYCQDIALPTGYAFVDEKFPLCNFEENLTVVSLKSATGEKFGFANEQGQIIINANFDEAYNFQDGLALVRQGTQYGYINPTGAFVIKPTFADAWGFSDGLAKVAVNDKIGFINKQGNLVIAPNFDDSHDWFASGVAGVFDKHRNQWGLIDKTGKLITPFAYDTMGEPANGRILVSKKMSDKTQYGYLSLDGNVAIQAQFDTAKKFANGVALVGQDNDKFYINPMGDKIEKKADFDYWPF